MASSGQAPTSPATLKAGSRNDAAIPWLNSGGSVAGYESHRRALIEML